MDYLIVAETYSSLEKLSSRIEITDTLSGLLKKTPKAEIGILAYLTQGKLRPDYEGVELGIAEKLALRALSQATGTPVESVRKDYVAFGDIGKAAEKILEKKNQGTLYSESLSLKRVYDTLLRVAKTAGSGSVETKLRDLISILHDATPLEAKYIMRTV